MVQSCCPTQKCATCCAAQLRNLGVPLKWSLMEDVKTADPRFADSPELEAFWKQVGAVGRRGAGDGLLEGVA